MPGVTNIQLTASLKFDDGHVITLSTPVWSKDVRQGWYFDDALTQEVIANSGMALAEIVEKETLSGIYTQMRALKDGKQQDGLRKPRFEDPFSNN